MTATVISIKAAADKRDRMEAFHLCESALPIYEEFFGESLFLRAAMVGAYDYATGLVDKKGLAEYHRDAQAVIDRSAQAMLRAPIGMAKQASGGIMAAYAILESLEQDINLAEVQRKVDKAFSFSPSRRAN